METTGLLKLGLVRAVARGTGELIGHAFTIENGRGQLQRWLLYRSPQNDFEIHPPPADKAYWTLSDFQANVHELWRPGAHYVWAQADVYQHGGTYDGLTWTRIPPEGSLPDPTYPPLPGELQLDPTPNNVLQVLQETATGLAYSIGGLGDAASVEYWLLSSGFQPAGGASSAAITPGTGSVGSLQSFLDSANELWGEGARLVITGCVNYTGEQPPSSP